LTPSKIPPERPRGGQDNQVKLIPPESIWIYDILGSQMVPKKRFIDEYRGRPIVHKEKLNFFNSISMHMSYVACLPYVATKVLIPFWNIMREWLTCYLSADHSTFVRLTTLHGETFLK
jgi:hypothetical protein